MLKQFLVSLLLLTTCSAVIAAGPQSFATIDRSKLKEAKINNQSDFNHASQLEIIAFAHELAKSEKLNQEQLATQLGLNVSRVNMTSIEQVRQRFWQRLLENYQISLRSCVQNCQSLATIDALKAYATSATIDPNRKVFHQTYLNEQLRLAALFPKISSEIDTFSPDELTGDSFSDGEFLLTFDDGPSPIAGYTDQLMPILQRHNLHSVFFLLGERLQQRLDKQAATELAALYQGQCVASHGWQHQSHSSWPQWQDSIIKTARLIRQTFSENAIAAFRPPYGQRKADSAAFFRQQKMQVVLWQIDSQDWSKSISSSSAGDRVLTLMLLWRKGIILFHDIHNKAPKAIELVMNAMPQNTVNWLDCRQYYLNKPE